eukprot:gene13201-29976_t
MLQVSNRMLLVMLIWSMSSIVLLTWWLLTSDSNPAGKTCRACLSGEVAVVTGEGCKDWCSSAGYCGTSVAYRVIDCTGAIAAPPALGVVGWESAALLPEVPVCGAEELGSRRALSSPGGDGGRNTVEVLEAPKLLSICSNCKQGEVAVNPENGGCSAWCSAAGFCGTSQEYKTTDCSDQKRRLASLLADQNREEGNDGQQQEEAAGCWRELDICSLGAYSSAPIPLSRVYIATVAASKRNSNNNDNSYTMNTNTNTNKEGWRHQVLLLGPGAAPPTCSTVLSVPASPGSSGGNSNGSNSDGPPPDPRLRIFIKPRYSRDAGAGPSYPGYLATADPMLLVAEATWGFELVLPENI